MSDAPTVLIVDDNRPLADGLAAVLPDEYDTRTAYTGEQARDSFRDDVDVVLLDRRLPDVPGERLLEEFRERDCPVAVVSAEARSPDLDCDAYLTKPLDSPEQLHEAVADLLGGVST